VGEELPGVVASPSWKRRVKGASWYEGDTVNSAIGQGYMQTTPLQLANGVAGIANRGTRFVPHLLLSEQQPGKKAEVQKSIPLEPVILQDKRTWEFVIDAMQKVVSSEGTAYRFGNNLPYTIAGKTGTAQVYSIKKRNKNDEAEAQENLAENLRDHSLFIAFAPVNKPQIAIAVLVENNNKLAVNVARRLLDYYFLGSSTNNENTTPTPEGTAHAIH
jgi:penicillin-binding protein 2